MFDRILNTLLEIKRLIVDQILDLFYVLFIIYSNLFNVNIGYFTVKVAILYNNEVC